MSVTPSVTPKTGDDGVILSLAGAWIIAAGRALETSAASVTSAAQGAKNAVIDLTGIERMDTAGAWVIDRARTELVGEGIQAAYRGARPEHAILLKEAGYRPLDPPKQVRTSHLMVLLAAVGETVYDAGLDLVDIVDYLGEIVVMWLRLSPNPLRWRWTSVAYHLEMYSLRSVPIIALINFLVGAIVMQQGVFQLARFGASPYAVNLVGVLGLRELGVLMTSIMIAGRTGSAITAEIGSMKMREEIDALKVMALDPLEVLVMPRLVALAVALPISDVRRRHGYPWGRPYRQLDLCRHDAGGVHYAPAGRHRDQHFSGRAHQGALYGGDDRPHRLDRGYGGARLRRIPWTLRDLIGGQVDLHGHRHGRGVRDVLYRDRLLSQDRPSTLTGRREAVIRVRGLKVGFGDKLVMDGLDLDLYRGEVLGFVGASGAGKSVLTRTILGLVHKSGGTIEVFGYDMDKIGVEERLLVEERWGVLFQEGALFSSLTVRQNIQAPMREHLNLSQSTLDGLAAQKLDARRPASGRGRQVPLRALGRHDEARLAGARARARSRNRVSRRADLGARSDFGRRLRRSDRHAAEDAWG